MSLTFGQPQPCPPDDYITMRCQAFWTEDGTVLPIGTIEVARSPDGTTTYQWSTVKLAAASKDALLAAIREAMQQG